MIKKSRSSIRDVAKLAGVSPITVSRVINSPELVKNKTKLKVDKAIEILNYQPNLLAKSLKSLSTKTIGVLLLESCEEFQQNILWGIEDVLRQNNYKILYGVSNNKVEIENYYLDTFVFNKVDGIIISSSHYSDGSYVSNIMNRFHIPIVEVDTFFDNFQFNYVLNSDKRGIKILAEHLTKVADENIAYLSGPLNTYSGKTLLQGFKEFIFDNNINYNKRLIKIGNYDFNSGETLTNELIKEELKFSSILASNYSIGLGALKSLFDHGKKIPRDIKIAAFDDFTLNPLLFVPLTTLSRTDKIIGKKAAELLLTKIKDNDIYNFKKIVVEGKLIKRRSTDYA